MLAGLLLGLIMLMRLYPSAPMVSTLHKFIVEIPALWIARAERRHVIFLFITVAMLMISTELIAIFGSFDVLLAFSLDLALYLDAAVAVYAIAAATRAKTLHQFMKIRLAPKHTYLIRCHNGGRSREIRANRTRPLPSNDDETAGPFSQAA